MKINCLECGHNVDVSEAYDDYNGIVRCFACHALLEIKSENGYLRSVQLVKNLSGLPVDEDGGPIERLEVDEDGRPIDQPEQTGVSPS